MSDCFLEIEGKGLGKALRKFFRKWGEKHPTEKETTFSIYIQEDNGDQYDFKYIFPIKISEL